MDTYIGCKIIKAEPAYKVHRSDREGDFVLVKSDVHNLALLKKKYRVEEGYRVEYPDHYVSFSPKKVFDKAYFKIGQNYGVSEEDADRFIKKRIAEIDSEGMAIVKADLINGFTITETESGTPIYSDEDAGAMAERCIDRIRDRVQTYLGFVYLWATGVDDYKGRKK